MKPEKADIIFIPGQWLFTDGGKRLQQLIWEKICAICPAKWKIQHHCQADLAECCTGQERYNGRVSDGMGIFKGCIDEESCAGRMLVLKEDQATFTWENARVIPRSYGSRRVLNIRKATVMLQKLSCEKSTDVLSEGISGSEISGMPMLC